MVATFGTSRICRCGCGERFIPHPSRPGTEYCYGHKPKLKAAAKPNADPLREKERELLDYRLAAATLRREILLLDKDIEAVDDLMEAHRQSLVTSQAWKDWAVDQRAGMTIAVQNLEALINGQPLPIVAERPEAK